MNTPTNHIIHRQELHFQWPNADRAHELNTQMEKVSLELLLEAIEAALDEIIPHDQVVQLHRLVLEVGPTSWEHLGEAWVQNVVHQLKQELAFLKQSATAKSLGTTTPLLSQLAQLQHYLQQGSLPWQAQHTVYTLWQTLAQQDRKGLESLFRQTGKHYTTRERIATRMAGGLAMSTLQVLQPTAADLLYGYHHQWITLNDTQGWIPQPKTTLEKSLWLFILNYLLLEQESTFNTRSMLKSTLRQLSHRFQVPFSQLVLLLHEALPATAESSLAPLRHALMELSEEVNQQPGKETPTTQVDTATLTHWLTEQFSQSPQNDAWKQLLAHLQERPHALADALHRVVYPTALVYHLTHHPTHSIGHKLVEILAASEANTAQSLHQSLAQIHRQEGLVPKQHREFEQDLWQFMVLTLLDSRGSQFNEVQFAEATLHQIAMRNQLEYTVLLQRLEKAIPKTAAETNAFTRLLSILLQKHHKTESITELLQNTPDQVGDEETADIARSIQTLLQPSGLAPAVAHHRWEKSLIDHPEKVRSLLLAHSTTQRAQLWRQLPLTVWLLQMAVWFRIPLSRVQRHWLSLSTHHDLGPQALMGELSNLWAATTEWSKALEHLSVAQAASPMANTYGRSATEFETAWLTHHDDRAQLSWLAVALYQYPQSIYSVLAQSKTDAPVWTAIVQELSTDQWILLWSLLLRKSEAETHRIFAHTQTLLAHWANTLDLPPYTEAATRRFLLAAWRSYAVKNLPASAELCTNGLASHFGWPKSILRAQLEAKQCLQLWKGEAISQAPQNPVAVWIRQLAKPNLEALIALGFSNQTELTRYVLHYHAQATWQSLASLDRPKLLLATLDQTTQTELMMRQGGLAEMAAHSLISLEKILTQLGYHKTTDWINQTTQAVLIALLRKPLMTEEELHTLLVHALQSVEIPGRQASERAEETAEKILALAADDRPVPSPIAYTYGEAEVQEYAVNNGGLVLFHPYLEHFFSQLGYLNEAKQFRTETMQAQAVLLLQYLFNGQTTHEEETLVLTKWLCGLELHQPVPATYTPTQPEQDWCQQMIKVLIQQCRPFQSHEPQGFCDTWLWRKARLRIKTDRHELDVEHRPFDLLLKDLPFTLSPVVLPWTDQPLHVLWKR